MQKEYQNDTVKGTNKKRRTIIIIVVSIVCLVSICLIANSIFLCAGRKCNRRKVAGGDMCVLHTCQHPDCFSSKSSEYTYCITHRHLLCDAMYCDGFAESYAHDFCKEHECTVLTCKEQKEEPSDYCSLHGCDFAGCTKRAGGYPETRYCSEHQPLKSSQVFEYPKIEFSLNSVGGINFKFEADHIAGKEIKYIRFPVYLYNAVGDSIKAKYGKSSHIDVEIIGPIYSYINYKDLIGYAENCEKIAIRDMTIVYADNTIQRVAFNYSYSRSSGRMSILYD